MAMRPPAPRGLKRRSPWIRLLLWVYFPALALVAAALILLWKSGHALVRGQPLERASWAFVLPGETPDCEATDAAAAWFEDGRIDTLVLVGSRLYKTHFLTEWARDYLENKGLPSERLFEMRLDAASSLDAARQVVRLARLQNLDTLHLIVSNFQSRRMSRLYGRLTGGTPVVKVHPIETPVIRPASWWATPQSQALWLFAWMGYAQTWWVTLGMEPDRGVAEVRNLTPDIWAPRSISQPEGQPETPVSTLGDSSATGSSAGHDSVAGAMAGNEASAALTQGLLDSAARVLDSLKRAQAAASEPKEPEPTKEKDKEKDKDKDKAKDKPKSKEKETATGKAAKSDKGGKSNKK